MRKLLIVCLLGLTGCAIDPVTYNAETPDAASLSMRDRPGSPFLAGHNGITSVDGLGMQNGPARSLRLKPGKHVLGYDCPGWLYVDDRPRLSHEFAAGAIYELDCGKEPHIEQVGPATP